MEMLVGVSASVTLCVWVLMVFPFLLLLDLLLIMIWLMASIFIICSNVSVWLFFVFCVLLIASELG